MYSHVIESAIASSLTNLDWFYICSFRLQLFFPPFSVFCSHWSCCCCAHHKKSGHPQPISLQAPTFSLCVLYSRCQWLNSSNVDCSLASRPGTRLYTRHTRKGRGMNRGKEEGEEGEREKQWTRTGTAWRRKSERAQKNWNERQTSIPCDD